MFDSLIMPKLVGKSDNHLCAKRLHFSKTTRNNRCYKIRPNPEQTYFRLIVEMAIVTKSQEEFTLYAAESQYKIVVRVNISFFSLSYTFN